MHKQNFFAVLLLTLLCSCGSFQNFNKQKFTDLKKIKTESTDETNEDVIVQNSSVENSNQNVQTAETGIEEELTAEKNEQPEEITTPVSASDEISDQQELEKNEPGQLEKPETHPEEPVLAPVASDTEKFREWSWLCLRIAMGVLLFIMLISLLGYYGSSIAISMNHLGIIFGIGLLVSLVGFITALLLNDKEIKGIINPRKGTRPTSEPMKKLQRYFAVGNLSLTAALLFQALMIFFDMAILATNGGTIFTLVVMAMVAFFLFNTIAKGFLFKSFFQAIKLKKTATEEEKKWLQTIMNQSLVGLIFSFIMGLGVFISIASAM